MLELTDEPFERLKDCLADAFATRGFNFLREAAQGLPERDDGPARSQDRGLSPTSWGFRSAICWGQGGPAVGDIAQLLSAAVRLALPRRPR